jgi:hypothetical protein
MRRQWRPTRSSQSASGGRDSAICGLLEQGFQIGEGFAPAILVHLLERTLRGETRQQAGRLFEINRQRDFRPLAILVESIRPRALRPARGFEDVRLGPFAADATALARDDDAEPIEFEFPRAADFRLPGPTWPMRLNPGMKEVAFSGAAMRSKTFSRGAWMSTEPVTTGMLPPEDELLFQLISRGLQQRPSDELALQKRSARKA